MKMASSMASDSGALERGEIDVSRPFESVKEAVALFGGSAVWKSQLKHFKPQKLQQNEDDNRAKKEDTAMLEKDAVMEEKETLDVIEEIENTKKIVEDLKFRYKKEASDVSETLKSSDSIDIQSILKLGELDSPEDPEMNTVIDDPSTEVEKSTVPISSEPTANLNLNKMVFELAEIRTSVQLLNNKIEKEKLLLEKTREKLVSGTSSLSEVKHSDIVAETSKDKEAKNIDKTVNKEAKNVAFSEIQPIADSESNSGVTSGLQLDDTNRINSELLMKVEEATEEVKVFTKALESALRRVEAANQKKLTNEEVLQLWESERCHNKTNSSSTFSGNTIGQILSLKKLMDTESEECAKVYDKENAEPNVSLAQMLDQKPGVKAKSFQSSIKSIKPKKLGFAGLSAVLSKQKQNNKKKNSRQSLPLR